MRMQEREKIRAEVLAEMNEQANTFVQEQIKVAHSQIYEEIVRQVAMRTGGSQPVQAEEEMPLSQNRNQPMRSESV